MTDSWMEPRVQFEARKKSLDNSFPIFQFPFKRTQLTYMQAIDSFVGRIIRRGGWLRISGILLWEFEKSKNFKVFEVNFIDKMDFSLQPKTHTFLATEWRLLISNKADKLFKFH